MIRKATRQSLVEQVVEQIEQLIEQGEWAVGDKLPPELTLMEEFAVSRNTLREAIRALVHAGLLESKQGSGTIVRASSPFGAALKRRVKQSTMLETLDVRLALEKQAVQMAAKHRTDEDLLQLESCIRACQNAAINDDFDQFIASDIQFHQTVVKASGNQLLIDLYDQMTDILYTFVHDLMAMDTPFHFEEELHIELFEAIKGQHKHHAAQYVDHYMDLLKETVLNMMEESD